MAIRSGHFPFNPDRETTAKIQNGLACFCSGRGKVASPVSTQSRYGHNGHRPLRGSPSRLGYGGRDNNVNVSLTESSVLSVPI